MARQLAVYGKGGIGKSTLTANLSAALVQTGKRVLQIGCDPKHDSTRLLLGGRRLTTVLDYLKSTPPTDYSLDAVLAEGFMGVGCIEAGGPEPGVGCAGRGIITAFKLLEEFAVRDSYDLVIYDVLGDVVCGGFAVPVRREYADVIFLVSSGEFMSLYAANNILRGIRNYDTGVCRVAGILYNERKVRDEDARMSAFAEAVDLPIVAKIPRDDAFARAERVNSTLFQVQGDKDTERVSKVFEQIAGMIEEGLELHEAKPLSDEELEDVVFGAARPVPSHDASVADKPDFSQGLETEASKDGEGSKSSSSSGSPQSTYISKNRLRSEPLYGCAFNGAATMSVHLSDCAIVLHGPRNCSYITTQTITSTARRRLFERGTLLPVALSPNIISTDMDENDMVFGGTGKLYETVRRLMDLDEASRPRAILVISSCAAGIIGDDIERVRELSTPQTPVLTIKADGNLSGDYLQGMLDCYTSIARQAIDKSVQPQPNMANIVFEKVVSKNTERNFRLIEGYLARMGVEVNCRFLCNTTYDAVRNFKAASLNLLAYNDYTGKLMKDFFTKEYGCTFLDRQFPVGFAETCEWLREVAAFFGRDEVAQRIIEENKRRYDAEIADLVPILHGKKLMISSFNHDIDWILSAALDCEMDLVKICVLYHSQDEGFRTRIEAASEIEVELDYDPGKLAKDIECLKPDILLSNYTQTDDWYGGIAENIPMCPDSGFFTGLALLRKWAQLFTTTEQGAWVDDRRLLDTIDA